MLYASFLLVQKRSIPSTMSYSLLYARARGSLVDSHVYILLNSGHILMSVWMREQRSECGMEACAAGTGVGVSVASMHDKVTVPSVSRMLRQACLQMGGRERASPTGFFFPCRYLMSPKSNCCIKSSQHKSLPLRFFCVCKYLRDSKASLIASSSCSLVGWHVSVGDILQLYYLIGCGPCPSSCMSTTLMVSWEEDAWQGYIWGQGHTCATLVLVWELAWCVWMSCSGMESIPHNLRQNHVQAQRVVL